MKNKQRQERLDSSQQDIVKTNIFGIDISNASSVIILKYVLDFLQSSDKTLSIVTPNPEMIVSAHHHQDIQDMLNKADIALCDGAGLFIASKFLRKPIKEKITGVDFMETLCQAVSKKTITVGFLGGRDGVAKKAAKCLMSKYPGLQVEFVGEEPEEILSSQFSTLNTKKEKTSKFTPLNYKALDILFVAFGFPKQEEWIMSNIGKLNIRVMMGVGGAFDYIGGEVPRAPKFLRRIGLEWLFRLFVQPWRWKRQLALLEFMWLVIQESLKKKNDTR